MTNDSPQGSMTVQQAADRLGYRADDLAALLQDDGIDVDSRGGAGAPLSAEQFERAQQLVGVVATVHAQGGLDDMPE